MLDVLLGIPNWLIILLTLGLIIFYLVWHYTQLQRLGYKCSVPWPIVGHWHMILQKGYRSDTANKDAYGKVFAQYEGLRPSIVICDPKLVKESTVTKFSDFPQRIVPFPVSPEVEYAVTTALGAEWKRQRNIMTRAFSASKMRKLSVLINGCARQFCDALQKKVDNKENIEVRKTCGEFVMRVVATSLFGIDVSKDEELSKFAGYAVKMSQSLDLKNPVMFLSLLSWKMTLLFKLMGYGYKRRGPVKIECFNFFKRTVIALKKSREQLEEREKPNDLLQLLLDGHKGDDILRRAAVKTSAFDETDESLSVAAEVGDSAKRGFSTEEIVSNAIIFFSAGYITTTAALGWMMYLLACHPDVQERLHNEIEEFWTGESETSDLSYDTIGKMDYLDQVFCETLRVFPSTQRLVSVLDRCRSELASPLPQVRGFDRQFSWWAGGLWSRYRSISDLLGPLTQSASPPLNWRSKPLTWSIVDLNLRNDLKMDRVAVRDSTVGGKPVPKGVQVNISIWSIHHDEDYWPDPFKFDPDRFAPENKDNLTPYAYIPFGSGPRNCIGMRLATLEAKIAVSHLLKRFRLMPCAETEIPPNLRNQVHTAPSAGIVLQLEPRN